MVNVSGLMSNTLENNSITKPTKKNGSTDKSDNQFLFKGFVQIIPTSPMAELSLMDADLDEYVSRHALDGTLLFADHRLHTIEYCV